MYVRRFLLSTLVVVGILAVSHSSAFAQGSPLFAVLNGGNEISAAGVARAGDPDGFGSATVTFSNITSTNARLCYAILVSNIALPAAAAHIHRGQSGVNGGVEVPLTAPGVGGTVSGCVSITLTLYGQLRAFPAQFYVNVHNAAFPSGAVRGQLF